MSLPVFVVVPLGASAPSGPEVVVVAVEPSVGTDASAQPVRGVLAGHASLPDLTAGSAVRDRLVRAEAKGRAGEITTVRLAADDAPTVLALGVGGRSPADLRRAGAALSRRLAGKSVRVSLGSASAGQLEAFVDGYGLAAYAPPRTGVTGPSPASPPTVSLVVRDPKAAAAAVERAARIVRAVHLARDLAHTPANLKSPQWLAEQAARVAGASGLTVRVRDERELLAEGFGGLIGVGQGSSRPPRFVELGYVPAGLTGRAARAREHVVLVGKGITFDSGGISIKPAANLELMKTDMAGAAAVIGTMSALADLGVTVRVTALLAIAENLPGAAALRPGDVITPYGGARTVEVLNTDAEGRLVLADALAYADRVLAPDVVIDLATLTGAATLALGRRDAPLYATDERLAVAIERAAAESGERVWRMPLVDDYRSAIDSDTADLANAATGGVGAGSITAALFLREFTGGRAWAHLDIAGTGRSDRDVDELCKGGTGFGVRLLLSLLRRR